MEILTYSLKDDQADAAQYYRDVAALTDEVLAEVDQRLPRLLVDFETFLKEFNSPTRHMRLECVFELLILGVLWKIYMPNAMALSPAAYPLLAWLGRLRERGGKVKKYADRARRVSNTLLFDRRKRLPPGIPPRFEHLQRLVHWLAASGDYSAQLRRLQDWEAYLCVSPEKSSADLTGILSLADWFEERSLQVLGGYTRQVEHFLAVSQPRHRWHEDVITCARPRLEYHLNMVGNELLNRAYRADFLTSKRKVVVVPPCMHFQEDDHCAARATPFGLHCVYCAPDCRVNHLTRLGEKYGFDVVILPEDLMVFSAEKASGEGKNLVGIVGVSCVLTNAPGGWDARKNGILAQGVPLDYCGCAYHWRDPRLSTDVDFKRILDVLGIVPK